MGYMSVAPGETWGYVTTTTSTLYGLNMLFRFMASSAHIGLCLLGGVPWVIRPMGYSHVTPLRLKLYFFLWLISYYREISEHEHHI